MRIRIDCGCFLLLFFEGLVIPLGCAVFFDFPDNNPKDAFKTIVWKMALSIIPMVFFRVNFFHLSSLTFYHVVH